MTRIANYTNRDSFEGKQRNLPAYRSTFFGMRALRAIVDVAGRHGYETTSLDLFARESTCVYRKLQMKVYEESIAVIIFKHLKKRASYTI